MMRENGGRVEKRIPTFKAGAKLARRLAAVACALLLLLASSFAQSEASLNKPASKTYPPSSSSTARRDYPKEIRGYKLARAKVEIRKAPGARDGSDGKDAGDADALIQFGEPRIVSTTPLGMTLEVPVTMAAVKQGGHVDFLTFEDVTVNGMPVSIEDYMYSFELPNKEPVALPQPIRIFINTARAVQGAISDWSNPKETWPVTARVYVFGKFRKFIFTAKRVVPIELTMTLPNPLRNQKSEQKISDPAIKQ